MTPIQRDPEPSSQVLTQSVLGTRVKKFVESKLLFLATTAANGLAVLLVLPFAWFTFIPGVMMIIASLGLYLFRYRIGSKVAVTASLIAAFVACVWCAVAPVLLAHHGYVITAIGNPIDTRWITVALPDTRQMPVLLVTDPLRAHLARLLCWSDSTHITASRTSESLTLLLPVRGALLAVERPPVRGFAVHTHYYPSHTLGRVVNAPRVSDEIGIDTGSRVVITPLLSDLHLALPGGPEWNMVRTGPQLSDETVRYAVLLNESVEALMRGDARRAMATLEHAAASAPTPLERARVLCLEARVSRDLLGGNLGVLQSLVYLHAAYDVVPGVLPETESGGPVEAFIARVLHDGYEELRTLFPARVDYYGARLDQAPFYCRWTTVRRLTEEEQAIRNVLAELVEQHTPEEQLLINKWRPPLAKELVEVRCLRSSVIHGTRCRLRSWSRNSAHRRETQLRPTTEESTCVGESFWIQSSGTRGCLVCAVQNSLREFLMRLDNNAP